MIAEARVLDEAEIEALHEGEIQELMVLLLLLETIKLLLGEEDGLVWTGHKSRAFSVISAYAGQAKEIGSDSLFPREGVWSVYWPFKHSFLLWQAILNDLPTQSNLQRRGSALFLLMGLWLSVVAFCMGSPKRRLIIRSYIAISLINFCLISDRVQEKMKLFQCLS